jgi:hypothetical protein
VIQLLAKNSTYWIIRVVGLGFLAAYLFFSREFTFSFTWASAYVVVTVLIALLLAKLRFLDRFPALNGYYFFRATKNSEANHLTENEWAIKKAAFLESGLRPHMILYAPSEDGLICVPVLLVGINPVTAFLGGLVFGLLHLRRFTYLECIGKTIIYSLVCFLILPHGILTVVAGHFATDLLGLASLKLIKGKLK